MPMTPGERPAPDMACSDVMSTLFTPKHPATKARQREVEQAESTLPLEEMIARAVDGAVREDFSFPL